MIEEFLEYARSGNIAKIREFIENGFDVNQVGVRAKGMFLYGPLFFEVIKDYAHLDSLDLDIKFNPLEVIDILVKEGHADMTKLTMQGTSILDEYMRSVSNKYQHISTESVNQQYHAGMIQKILEVAPPILNNIPQIGYDTALISAIKLPQELLMLKEFVINGLVEDLGVDINPSFEHISPLLAAIDAKDIDSIQYFINKGADVNVSNVNFPAFGINPLFKAIYSKNATVLKIILDQGVDVNYYDPNSFNTPLLAAISVYQDFPEGFDMLIEKNADVNKLNPMMSTPLMSTPFWHAVSLGHFDLAKTMHQDMKAEIFPHNYNNKNNALFGLVSNEAMQKFILSNSHNIPEFGNIPDDYIIHTAFFAWFQGDVELTNNLIRRLDTIDSRDMYGKSIFDYINQHNSYGELANNIDINKIQDIENPILRNFVLKAIKVSSHISTDIELYKEENFIPKYSSEDLIKAIRNEDIQLVQNILESGFDSKNIDHFVYPNPPLMEAIFCNQPKIAKVLLQHGESAKPADNNYHNLLDNIILNYNLYDKSIIEMMIQNGAEINPSNKEVHMTPFWNAVIYKNLDLIDYLLELGAEIFPANLVNDSVMNSLTYHPNRVEIFNIIADHSNGNIPDSILINYIPAVINAKRWSHTMTEDEIFRMIDMIKDINSKDRYDNTIVSFINTGDWNYESKYVKFLVETLGYKITIMDILNSFGEKADYIKSVCGEFDYNAAFDNKGNTNIMKMAQMGRMNDVEELLNQKDKNGLPIIDVNKTNNDGYNLIHHYSAIQRNDDMINLLRKLGSAEPKSKIAPSSGKLRLNDVHNVQNQGAAKKIINMLHDKFSLDPMEKDQLINDLINRIKSMEQEINDYYTMIGPDSMHDLDTNTKFDTILKQVQDLGNDSESHNEDCINWEFKDVIAHVYKYVTEVKPDDFMGLVHSFSLGASCLPGFLINILVNAEEDNIEEFKYFVDPNEYYSKEKYDEILDQFMIILNDRSIDKADIVKEFYQNITEHRGEVNLYSKAASYTHGAFLELLLKTAASADAEIYSEDVQLWGRLEQMIVSEYGDWDLGGSEDYHNDFYKLLGESLGNDSEFI